MKSSSKSSTFLPSASLVSSVAAFKSLAVASTLTPSLADCSAEERRRREEEGMEAAIGGSISERMTTRDRAALLTSWRTNSSPKPLLAPTMR